MLKIITYLNEDAGLAYVTAKLREVPGVLIVPEQSLFETERLMYSLLGAARIAATEITGLSKLAAEIVRRYSKPKLYADDIVKSLTMYKTLRLLRGYSSYEAAGRSLRLAADFKNAAITPDELREKLSRADAEKTMDSTLLLKLYDICEIYEAYCESLEASFADSLDDCRIAAGLVNLHDCYKGKTVCLHGFDGFSASQLGLVKALSESADCVEILLRCDDDGGNPDFRAAHSLIERFRRDFSDVSAENLPGESNSPATELWLAESVERECEFICAKIRELITEGGYTCNEIAVLVCDGGGASAARLKESMAEYELPCYADLPEPIITKPMVRFIISALDAVGLDTPEILAYVRSGFVRVNNDNLALKLKAGKRHIGNGGEKVYQSRRLSRRSMDKIERLARKYSLTKREWAAEFPANIEELAKIEPLRRAVVLPLTELRNNCAEQTGDKITEEVCRFLIDTMQLQRSVLSLCNQSEGLIEGKNVAEESRQLWDLMIEVFESLHAALKGFPLTLPEYAEILRGIFMSVNIARPPQAQHAVIIGDLSRSRLRGIRAAFVAGANRGAFPKSAALESAGESGLGGRDIEAMADCGLELTARLEERYYFERLMVNKAMTLPSKLLFISAPLSDSAWNELIPAPVLDPKNPQVRKTADLSLEFRARTLRAARRIFAEEGGEIPAAVLREENAGLPLPNRDRSGDHVLTAATAERLFSSEYVSPSAIEMFMACRFRYFCRYGLRLNLPELINEEEPPGYERGLIIHHCLDTVLREYKDKLGDLAAMSDAELGAVAESRIREYRAMRVPGDYAPSRRRDYLTAGLRAGIARMLRHFCGEFARSGFKPAAFEKQFDYGYSTAFGDVRLKGKIDRVDRCGDCVRVVDYKSGVKEMDLGRVFYGLDMQMLLYLFAECGATPGAAPGAALYVPSDGTAAGKPLIPAGGKITADAETARRAFLSAHTANGVVIGGEGQRQIEILQSAYAEQSNSPRSKFFKAQVISPESYSRLQGYCEKLIAAQLRRLKHGEVQAVPLAEKPGDPAACGYCDFAKACGRSRVKLMNLGKIYKVLSQRSGTESPPAGGNKEE